MVAKPYLWQSGATLQEHSKRKHKIIREYFSRYLAVRCQHPQQSRFRLAVVEGFSGGGRYSCGAPGSPVIFIEELRNAAEKFNIARADAGMALIDIECLLVFNDESPEAIEFLKTEVEPLLASVKSDAPKLHLRAEYSNKPFEVLYPEVKQMLERGGYHNVLFNLDQCGHAHVERKTIADIIASFSSAEIFYTFAIESLLAFLAKGDPKLLATQIGFVEGGSNDLSVLEGRFSKNEWLGAAERLVFASFRNCAKYVSPFSINNPEGWRYWLIHFAGSYRARQEYNNILHQNSSAQAHFGRSGLHMLSYDPNDNANGLYLFDVSGRSEAKRQLSDDIPRLVNEFGDTIGIGEFYGSIYNMTPAHMDDVHTAIMENPDLEVLTGEGGRRRKANTITVTDTLRLRRQRSFFPIFLGPPTSK